MVLLESSMSCWASSQSSFSSTGELDSLFSYYANTDSINIAYSDLREVNVRLLELNYTKAQLNNYKMITYNDSIIIESCNKEKEQIYKKYKASKIAAITCGTSLGVAILTTVLTILLK